MPLNPDNGESGPDGGASPASAPSTLIALPLVDCWNRIGVGGDQSCPELKALVHCRECPVFAEAARSFFDRPAPEGYLADWSRWLAAPDELAACRDETSDREHHRLTRGIVLLVFRLGSEWLAIEAKAVAEVVAPRPVHRVPHRTNAIFTGIMSLRGQIVLCVSLHGLLGIDPETQPPRTIVLHDRERGEIWAFAADEVAGVEQFDPTETRQVPTTLSNPAVGFGKAVVTWKGRTVDLLDEQRVFAALGGYCS